MNDILEMEASVTSKRHITLPVALRAKLGIAAASKVKVTYNGKPTGTRTELPAGAFVGMLRHLGDIDTTLLQEPDRF